MQGSGALPEDLLSGDLVRVRRGTDFQVCFSPGSDPTVVFLHGGLGNRLNWRSQYERAVRAGWAAFTYDLAGHGQSSAYPRHSLGRHRRDLTRLLRRFRIRRPLLCCHSYGVPLGLEWAQRHPTCGMVAIAGGTHDLDPWWEIPLMKGLTLGGRHLFHLPVMQRLARAWTSRHRSRPVEKFLDESAIPTAAEPYQALESFWQYDFFARRKTRRLQRIPILVISGSDDPAFTFEMGEVLAASFNQGRHLHIPEAGHLVMAEHPDVVHGAIATLRAESDRDRHSNLP